MHKAAILIPIYKTTPSDDELISLRQCIQVLSKHHIIFFTSHSTDTSFYEKMCAGKINYRIEKFDNDFFKNIDGYNKLLLSRQFYQRFAEYEYILIHQLDAFVFRDELDYWCKQGYDFIGAPWFTDNKSHEEGGTLWAVGNGGFSLRKISAFRNLFSSTKNVYDLKYLLKKLKRKKKNFLWLLRSYFFGYENKFQYLVDNWTDAEDLFFCLKLADTKLKLNISPISKARFFSFERSPQYLFNLNNQILPFGCHAWQKYEYENFWKKYITEVIEH